MFKMVQASQLCFNKMGVPLVQCTRKSTKFTHLVQTPDALFPEDSDERINHATIALSRAPTAVLVLQAQPCLGDPDGVGQCQRRKTCTTRPSELLSVSPHLHNKAF